MGTSRSLAEAGAKLDKALSPKTLQLMTRAGGKAAQKAAEEAAVRDLGANRAMDNWKGGKLVLTTSARPIDVTTVLVKYTPPGAWVLADKGRKRTKRVVAGARGKGTTKGARNARVFRTPQGPRRAFTSGPSRGLGTLADAQDKAQREVPKAAARELIQQLGKVF